MKLLDISFETPEKNLSFEESLLEACEAREGSPVIRFWSPKNYFVVTGYSNDPTKEVRLDFCRQNKIPVLKRISGGGTVLQGPGCLNYALILRIHENPSLQSITSTNQFIMNRHREALGWLTQKPVHVKGHTDLTIHDLKFSGNAQRRKRKAVLFHGTFLLNFDLTMIEKTLPKPSQEPAYRRGRSHTEFLTNLHLPEDCVKDALKNIWI